MKASLFLKFLMIAIVGFFLAKICYHFSDNFLDEKISSTLHDAISITDGSITQAQAFSYKNVEKIVINNERAGIVIQKDPVNSADVKIKTTNHSLRISQTNQVLTLTLSSHRSITLSVPATVNSIEVNTKSGDIKITDLGLSNLVLNTFSGSLNLDNVSADQAFIKSMRGNIDWKGMAKKLQAKTMSAHIKLDTTFDKPSYDLDTVSGDVNILTTKPLHALLDLKSVSGEIETDPVNESEARSETAGIIKVRTVNGNIQINHQK